MSDAGDRTRELLMDLRLPSQVTLSADGRQSAFSLADTSTVESDPGRSSIWTGPLAGPLREVCGGGGAAVLPAFSPDGATLAFAADHDHIGRLSLYLLDTGSPEAEPRSHGALEGTIEAIEWSGDGSQVLVLTADMGSDSAGVNVSRVLAEADVEAPDPLVRRPGSTWRRLYAIDLVDGESIELGPPGVNVWEFAWAADGVVAVVSDDPSEGGWYDAYLARLPVDGSVDRLYAPEWQIQGPRLSPDGTRVAFVEGVASDRLMVTGTLVVLDLSSGETIRPAERLDVSQLAWVEDGRIAYAGRRGLEAMCGFVTVDGRVDEVWGGPAQLGVFHVTEFAVSVDGGRIAAAMDGIGRPPEVHVLDTAAAASGWSPITSFNAPLAAISVPDAGALTWESSDGLAIEGLVLTPGGGRPGPLPLVVIAHGGPTFNWSYAFAPGYLGNALCLVNAGYAVLMPNVRGSTGRGQDFARANLGDLGGRELDDLLSGVDACVAAGIADGDRVGITGNSHGGYVTAWAVTQTDRFAAAVAVSSISNWLSFHNTANIGRYDEIFLGSDPYDRDGNHFDRSPVMHARSVRTPTLFMHGDLDLVTPKGQAQEMHQALAAEGCETELVIYPREGHGHAWAEQDHLIDAWARLRGWFDRHLK